MRNDERRLPGDVAVGLIFLGMVGLISLAMLAMVILLPPRG